MEDQSTGRGMPRWGRLLLIALAVVAVAGLIWRQLPSGTYATDLSRIGAGRPVVVLAQDPNFAGGLAVMELLNKVRGDYAERVEFLVAPLVLPEGRAFGERHAVGDGSVLLFAADGSRVGVLPHPKTTDELRRALNQAFGW
jgi:hypothetical protein